MVRATVRDRQTMLDVGIQATGSITGALALCAATGRSITDLPTVGTVVPVSDAVVVAGDAQAAAFFADNGIVVVSMGLVSGDMLLSEDGITIESEDGDVVVAE